MQARYAIIKNEPNSRVGVSSVDEEWRFIRTDYQRPTGRCSQAEREVKRHLLEQEDKISDKEGKQREPKPPLLPE